MQTATVIEGQDIELVRALILRASLRLECLGLRRSHLPSACVIVKREFGFRGNKLEVYRQFNSLLVTQLGAINRPL